MRKEGGGAVARNFEEKDGKTNKIWGITAFFSRRQRLGLEFSTTFGYDDGAPVSKGETRGFFLDIGTKNDGLSRKR